MNSQKNNFIKVFVKTKVFLDHLLYIYIVCITKGKVYNLFEIYIVYIKLQTFNQVINKHL